LRLSSRFLSKWNGRKPSPEHSAELNRGEAIADRLVESTRKKDRTKVRLRESQVVVPSQRNGVSDHPTPIVEKHVSINVILVAPAPEKPSSLREEHETLTTNLKSDSASEQQKLQAREERSVPTVAHEPPKMLDRVERPSRKLVPTAPGRRPSPAPKSTPEESARPALTPHIRDILDNAHRMARERGGQLEQPKQLDRRHTNFNPEITRAPTARQEQIETYRTSAESYQAFIPTGDGKTSCLLEVREANPLKSFDLGEVYSRGCVARP
jgi:hypothetical protein